MRRAWAFLRLAMKTKKRRKQTTAPAIITKSRGYVSRFDEEWRYKGDAQ